MVFRTLLFKIFNRIETWERLCAEFGEPSWRGFERALYDRMLSEMLKRGERIYSAAYIMPSPRYGAERKHSNHLLMLEKQMEGGLAERICAARSLEHVYDSLRSCPSLGPFLAFQFAIDLNYGPDLDFSEMEFVVAGPGARDGIRKCFKDTAGLCDSDVIRVMADIAELEFDRLGLRFDGLWGRQLQLIDCQNLFCEVDKYARVAHPDVTGRSGRMRIKQKYEHNRSSPLAQWYPPKWGLQPAALLGVVADGPLKTQLALELE